MMTDKERAATYAAFLNRLYLYRNVTMDHTRIQQWLSKLDEWGRASDDQFTTDEEWEGVMESLLQPESAMGQSGN